MKPPIVCRYKDRPGWSAACGAFTLQHREQAAAAGVCCVTLAFDLARGER